MGRGKCKNEAKGKINTKMQPLRKAYFSTRDGQQVWDWGLWEKFHGEKPHQLVHSL